MARYKGHQGDVSVGGVSVGERIDFDINLTAAEADASTQGNDWTDTDGLQKSAEGSLNVFYDPTDAAQTSLAVGDTVTCVFYPAGNSTGLRSLSGDFLVTSVSANSSVSDNVKRTYQLKNKGTVTEAVIA